MNLNQQQKDIVYNAKGHNAVVAGAGSGKSTTNIKLIERLYKQGVPLEKMFISTFTNKAGRDLKVKLNSIMGIPFDKLEKLWIGTFHSLGYRYLSMNNSSRFEIILPVEANYYLRNIYKDVLQDEGVKEDVFPFKDAYQSLEDFRNLEKSWKEVSTEPAVSRKIYERYQKEKKKNNLVDYTDILYMFCDQVKEDKDFSSRFDWVFVDECQDNMKKQHEIADLLSNSNRILIGDPKQSIYGFRGAAPELFKKKISEFEKVYPLAYNYRSSKQIIDLANVLLEQQPEFKEQTLIPVKGDSFKPEFVLCDNGAQEIFNNILTDIKQGIPLHEIAVLGRSVKPMLFQNLQILLRSRGIGYTMRGGDDKLNASYIQNFLSLIKSVLSPSKISLTNTLSILPSVGPKRALKLAGEVMDEGGDFRVLALQTGSFTKTNAYQKFIELEEYVDENKDKKKQFLKALEFYHAFYLKPVYSKKDPDKPESLRKIIFDSLFEYLMEYRTLLEGIDSLYINEEDLEAEKDKIVISTIHQCVTGDTLVETPRGILPIKYLPSDGEIATPLGVSCYKGKFKREKSTTQIITTKKGYSIEATLEHGFSVYDGENFVRKNCSDLREGDLLRLKLGETCEVKDLVPLWEEDQKDIREVIYPTPAYLEPELGELIGLILGDGTIYSSGIRIIKNQEEVIDHACNIFEKYFSYTPKRKLINGRTPCLEINSTFLSRWFSRFKELLPNSKNVPETILRSPINVQKFFLRGLFEDGTVGVRIGWSYIDFKNKNKEIIKTVQVMLLRLGIVSSCKLDAIYNDKNISSLYVFGYYAQKYREDIGFVSNCKQGKLLDSKESTLDAYIVPISKKEAYAIGKENFDTLYDWQNTLRRGYLGKTKVLKLLERKRIDFLEEKLRWHYEKIADIGKSENETYCIEVPEGSRFLQNGFDAFNSKGLEFESVHIANFHEGSIPALKEKDEPLASRHEEEFCLAYVAITRAKTKLKMYMQFMSGFNSYSKPNKFSRYIKHILGNYKENYFKFIIRGVDDPISYKEKLYNKLKNKI